MRTIRLFGLFLRPQHMLLALLEFSIFMGSVYTGALVRFGGSYTTLEAAIGWPLPRALLFAITMVLSMAAMGLYNTRRRERMGGTVLRIGICLLCGSIALVACFYVAPELYLGRGAFALALAVSALGIGSVRAVTLSAFGEQLFMRRVLVVGTGTKASAILDMRRRTDWRGMSLVGFIQIPGGHSAIDPAKIINIDRPLFEFALEREIDQVVVALDDRRTNFPLDELLKCRMNGIEVIEVSDFLEREFRKIRLDFVDLSHLIYSDGFRRSPFYQYLKRGVDIALAVLVMAVTWPVMAATALAIRVEGGSKCPILYRQLRVSQGNKAFAMLKFRSMRVDAEKDGQARWAEPNDSRITRVGAVIRKYRIDELPQIFNVLQGDMSFVGPRPERPEFVSELTKTIPLYGERHQVKAGLSGWAQLCYPYGASEKDAVEKLQYDLYYVKNYSPVMDLFILIQTAEVILFGKGAR